MSLTSEAFEERKWGPFPALRQVLASKQVPDSYFGLSSVSDNVFARLDRLLHIAILAEVHRDEVGDAMPTIGVEDTMRDLQLLEEMLYDAAESLGAQAKRIRSVATHAYEQAQERDARRREG